jgi:DNA-nicking Smr family endonuclease
VSKRFPSEHERRLWRESNRFTIRRIVPQPACVEDEAELMRGEMQPPASPSKPAQSTPHAIGTKKALSPLEPMGARAANQMLKSRGPIMATLDLHGLTKIDAYTHLRQFIAQQFHLHHRHLLIITGKGRTGAGVLRRAVPEWLNETDMRFMIAGFAQASIEKGGEGALHVLLKKCHG